MRLWHKDLIKVLPDDLLKRQWMYCNKIANNIHAHKKPGDIFVSKIEDYPLNHFHRYCLLVRNEMIHRGFKRKFEVIDDLFDISRTDPFIRVQDLFPGWHNERYLLQCTHMLQERYDCGGMTLEEWVKILKFVPFLSLKEKVV